MSKSSFVDFKAIKAAINMEQVLQHYGLLDQFKKSGDSLSGPCPIHKGSNPTQFRVSLSKNVWNCFSECKGGGNVLDFIAKLEDVTIHAAALKAMEWFGLTCDTVPNSDKGGGKAPDMKNEASSAKGPSKTEAADPNAPNKPLKFRLEKLEREHPYFAERGLSPETVATFDVGYCSKGMMAERIAIPIHNPEGQVVAYAGRWLGEPPGDTPKYKLPQGFRKSLEIFNLHRAIKEAPEKPLVIVEGFFGCMKLHEWGCRKVVAIMGSILSGAQEELIRKHTTSQSLIIVMFDEDEAGKLGREDCVVRLSRFAFVKVYVFPKPDMQPEHLSPEKVHELIGGVP